MTLLFYSPSDKMYIHVNVKYTISNLQYTGSMK